MDNMHAEGIQTWVASSVGYSLNYLKFIWIITKYTINDITKGGSRRLEKSHEVWMMMIAASFTGQEQKEKHQQLALSGIKKLTIVQTTQLAQDDLQNYDGSRGSRSKNSHSYFKFILFWFLPNVGLYSKSIFIANLIQIGRKTYEVRDLRDTIG